MFGRKTKVRFEEFCKTLLAGFIRLNIHIDKKLTGLAQQFDFNGAQIEAIRAELDVFRIALLYTFMVNTADKMNRAPHAVAQDFRLYLPQVFMDLNYSNEKAESAYGQAVDYMDFVSNLSPDQAREKEVYRHLCFHFADRAYGVDTSDDKDFTVKHGQVRAIGLIMFRTLRPIYDENAKRVVYQD